MLHPVCCIRSDSSYTPVGIPNDPDPILPSSDPGLQRGLSASAGSVGPRQSGVPPSPRSILGLDFCEMEGQDS